MNITQNSSDDSIMNELARRIARSRLNQNRTQAEVAKESGISLRTLARIESGGSVQLVSLIRVFRTLGLAENFGALLPESEISPMQQLKMQGRTRRRASSGIRKRAVPKPWSWGDD